MAEKRKPIHPTGEQDADKSKRPHTCCEARERPRGTHPNRRHAPPDRNAGTFTCPMHPEVVRDCPGDCPICAMALEPSVPGTQEESDSELRFLSLRLRIAAALTLPVFVLAMGKMLPGMQVFFHSVLPHDSSKWIEFLFATPVVFWCGGIFFQRGWRSVCNRNPNMFTLIMLGVGAAYGFSVTALLFPQLFPPAFHHPDGSVGLYFEAAAVITTLVLLGQLLEARARRRTGAAVTALLRLTPKTAHRLIEHEEHTTNEGPEEDIPLDRVCPGDLLRVKPGEGVPVDGILLAGESYIDESMITGEPTPVRRAPDDRVIGGTINQTGSFTMRAQHVGETTLLARIIQLVSQAQRSRAPIQQVTDAVANRFVPAVLVIALLTCMSWILWGPAPAASYALLNAVAVLIIACPCALGLATPISIVVGIGRAAQTGILIREAEAIEKLEKIDLLVTDKTGTLTAGNPVVTTIIAAGTMSEAKVLALAGAVETHSEHPIGAAVVAAARKQDSTLSKATGFQSITGQGVSAEVDGSSITVGKADFLIDRGVTLPTHRIQEATQLGHDGASVIWVASDLQVIGLIAVSDPIKQTTPAAITDLRRIGVELVMATGDNRQTAEAVGKQLGIREIHAELSPAEKIALIQRLRRAGNVVAMAGDGINDAPALAEADVGIAMGTGSDIAIGSSPVTLIKGDLRGIAQAITLSRGVMRNIRQNLFFAFGYNALGIPLAAGILYPFTGLLLNPMLAGAAMSLSSVSVIANALRLHRLKCHLTGSA